ncbi:uncharacterized protein PgNI_00563 [Pyricularia grisea]|uniref:Uncharacterized protein n=1 Tax=Pyricularia grisea TaxID=148305 RepID=A0A6P8BHZ1_PYRGI|nr:uncharacterized protein PgNI_00563 [Pyricularia grisea]TLD16239.1 hypothetical protein PgNI_00563 [Pyricularia grisea]
MAPKISIVLGPVDHCKFESKLDDKGAYVVTKKDDCGKEECPTSDNYKPNFGVKVVGNSWLNSFLATQTDLCADERFSQKAVFLGAYSRLFYPEIQPQVKPDELIASQRMR